MTVSYDVGDITPVLHVKNEEYWIHYVLRDVLSMFGRGIMIDTGSTDDTPVVARRTAEMVGADLTLIEEDLGDDAFKIGLCPTRLREMCPTYWMFLVDGDEIWRTHELNELCAQVSIFTIDSGVECVMFLGRNLVSQDGHVVERDGFWADRLFSPDVKWNLRIDYPFQSHGLEARDARGAVFRANPGVHFWHVRHLVRSSKDGEAFFRQKKRDYYPTKEIIGHLEPDWIGAISPDFPNPYLLGDEDVRSS
jgi:hypothetical protein